jgi:hypothetical protein
MFGESKVKEESSRDLTLTTCIDVGNNLACWHLAGDITSPLPWCPLSITWKLRQKLLSPRCCAVHTLVLHAHSAESQILNNVRYQFVFSTSPRHFQFCSVPFSSAQDYSVRLKNIQFKILGDFKN